MNDNTENECVSILSDILKDVPDNKIMEYLEKGLDEELKKIKLMFLEEMQRRNDSDEND